MDDFVQGVDVVAFCGFYVVCTTNVLELVMVPDDIVVQTLTVFVDFETDGRVGGNSRNLHGMADDGLVVDLRNFDKVFHIRFVEFHEVEISVARGVAQFRSEAVRVFGLDVCLRVLHI